MGALRISYFSLDLSIRRCFSFCSIYPQDFQIVKEQLVPLWMANGLIKARGNMEVEEVGNEVWDELLAETSYLEKRFQRDLDHLNLNFTLGSKVEFFTLKYFLFHIYFLSYL
ncbi:Putative disease resistance protein [Arachis hypogaea]|nr:Putative disease resistance protein [Arachis hypogaea]